MSKERNIEALVSEGIKINLREDLELLVGPHTDDCSPIDFSPGKIDELIILNRDRQNTNGWIVFDCWKDGKKWLGFLAVPPGKYDQIKKEIGYLEKIIKGEKWLPPVVKYYRKIENMILFVGDPQNAKLNHYVEDSRKKCKANQ